MIKNYIRSIDSIFKEVSESEITVQELDAAVKRANLVNLHFTFYAFSRRFYPKRLTLHSSYSFYILSALAFPGNRTHDLGVANAMLYQLSYRKATVNHQVLMV